MKLLGLIGKLICFWTRIEGKYKRIKDDEEKREASVKLGVRSILESVVSGAVIMLLLWGLYSCLNNFLNIKVGDGTYSMPVLTIIGIVVCGLGAVIVLFEGTVGALLYLIYQFKLNKKGVRWVALAVWLVMVAAIITFAIIIFLKL
ncbi:MAG: hypothetical protein ACI4MQ_07050 [Candidatus Coproplasma sp.]